MKMPRLHSRSRMHFPKRLRSGNQDGQALVEFALITPLLLLLVFGIIEFGLLWKSQQVLTDAAREGARSAVVADPDVGETDVYEVVYSALERGGIVCENCVDIEPEFFKTSAVSTGSPVTVSIEYAYDFIIFDRLVEWTAGDIILSSSSVMRKE